MGFLRNNKGSIISEWFMPLQKIGNIKENTPVDVSLMENCISIKSLGHSKSAVTIPYSKINDVFYGMKSELQQKKYSPFIRAAVGGLIFREVGAAIGAVSGLNATQRKVNKFYFAVSFINGTDENSVIWFQDTRLFKGRKLAEKLKELLELE